MSAAALPALEPVGAATREPLPATAAGEAGGPTPAPAAAVERVQQLQTLLAEVERGPEREGTASSSSFASTLDAAQAGAPANTVAASLPSQASAYAPLIDQAAARYGLDPALLAGLIQQESGFDPSARSSAGALGLTQLMPGTAATLGVAEPLDPAQSIEGGARYLSQLLSQFGGNTADALAAYNAGPGAVQQYGGVPPYTETQQYVTDVLGNAASFSPSEGQAPT